MKINRSPLLITLVEALNYRCLRYISQKLGSFHVLVGANGSGKSTFLDLISFMGDLVSEDLDKSIYDKRTRNFVDLLWNRQGNYFEIAIELQIPEQRKKQIKDLYDIVRYELRIGNEEITNEISILSEKATLKKLSKNRINFIDRTLFPMNIQPPVTILETKSAKLSKTIVNKIKGGNDNFYDETGKGWDHSFKLGSRKSALRNLPEDESKFPVSTWLKRILINGVQKLVLNSQIMRNPSPPGQLRGFRPDGSNLPWVIRFLKKENSNLFYEWIEHLQTALPDLKDIKTTIRDEDNHCYLTVQYKNNIEIPSWLVSDGTLRLLALTLLAYLPNLEGIFLIEEPENGIHPRAVETMFQSLSSVYNAQILMATHSPVILSIADVSKILCFAKTNEGAADIIPGNEHPALKDWRGEVNLSVLFASGVLG